jgi:hypothetical protein
VTDTPCGGQDGPKAAFISVPGSEQTARSDCFAAYNGAIRFQAMDRPVAHSWHNRRRTQTALVGVSYKFNWDDAVVAKY